MGNTGVIDEKQEIYIWYYPVIHSNITSNRVCVTYYPWSLRPGVSNTLILFNNCIKGIE